MSLFYSRRATFSTLSQGGGAESQAQQITSLLTQLRETNYLARRKAILALAQIGSPAVPALIQALRDENRNLRYSAAETLGQIGAAGQMGQHQKDAVSALKQALGDEDWLVRQRAKGSLKQIDPSFVMKATPPTISDPLVSCEASWFPGGNLSLGLECSQTLL